MEIFTIVAIAGLVIGVGAFLYNRRKAKKAVPVTPPTPLPAPKPAPVAKYSAKAKKQTK